MEITTSKPIKTTNLKTRIMKKLLLLATFAVSYCVSAQDLFIQNYTDTILEYTIWKDNQANIGGGCQPNLESRDSVTGLSILGSTISSMEPREAFYKEDLTTTMTFNSFYPNTPLIDKWILNADFANPLVPPNPALVAPSLASQWSGIKFGVRDLSGTAIGGYYTMAKFCGQPIISDLSAYTNPAVNGTLFTAGGATWIIIY